MKRIILVILNSFFELCYCFVIAYCIKRFFLRDVCTGKCEDKSFILSLGALIWAWWIVVIPRLLNQEENISIKNKPTRQLNKSEKASYKKPYYLIKSFIAASLKIRYYDVFNQEKQGWPKEDIKVLNH